MLNDYEKGLKAEGVESESKNTEEVVEHLSTTEPSPKTKLRYLVDSILTLGLVAGGVLVTLVGVIYFISTLINKQ